MAVKFIGRRAELALLESFVEQPTASLLVVHGRRRIGKSRLIDEFAKHRTYYRFTGLAPHTGMTAQMQRVSFAKKLGDYFGIPGLQADDWADLFTVLAHQCRHERVVILLDEISWMGMKDPTFLSKLKDAWDTAFKMNPKLILILCGSISSWIEKNILSSTGFLGRIRHVLTLGELPLQDCIKFWGIKGKNISAYEKLKFLSVTGGVPLYLESMNPGLTAEENIRRLCFIPGGLLVREFDNIFSDLFSKRSALYQKIISTLAKGAADIQEICQHLGIEHTGWVTEHLHDLQISGFISRDYTWHFSSGKDAKFSHYRLSDNYMRFYLKYIEKYRRKIESNDFAFKSLHTLPGWSSMMGFQFENLVLKNRAYIKERLHIMPDEVISDNPFFQRVTARQPGCQIDYLIQTKFNSLYACEIKFARNTITIGIIDEMQKKLERLKLPKGFSVRPVLIHVNGVTNDIIDSYYFADIISFEDLLLV